MYPGTTKEAPSLGFADSRLARQTAVEGLQHGSRQPDDTDILVATETMRATTPHRESKQGVQYDDALGGGAEMRNAAQNAAYLVIALAVLALAGWFAWSFFTAAEVMLWVRIAVAVVGVAFVVLLAIAATDRIKQARQEDFKDVET
jgi:hypothetical protein